LVLPDSGLSRNQSVSKADYPYNVLIRYPVKQIGNFLSKYAEFYLTGEKRLLEENDLVINSL
jgi:hypothetical protein